MNQTLKKSSIEWRVLWLALGTVLYVMAWRGWVVAHNESSQWEAVAGEFISIPKFLYGIHPNHAGSALIYGQNTEAGVTMFFYDLVDGKKVPVCEQVEKDWSWQYFGMLSWTPDDTLFACAYPPKDPLQPKEVIVVGDGKTGKTLARLEASRFLREFTWLSAQSFAYSYWDRDRVSIQIIEHKPDGNWVRGAVFKQIGGKTMKELVATSSASVAWREEGSIWALDFKLAISKKVWEATTNELLETTALDQTGELLLHCRGDNGQFLLRLNPRDSQVVMAGEITGETNPVQNISWYNGEPRYVYLAKEGATNVFHVKSAAGSELIRLPWSGTAEFYKLSGDHLFIDGNLADQPRGIWDCRLSDGSLSCVILTLERQAGFATWVAPMNAMLTNAAGQEVPYHLWAPARLVAGKKYPVVIGQTTYDWQPYPQIAANAGYYYAIAERPSWFNGLEHWSDDVASLYRVLSKNSSVDTNRVYLYACSAETGGLMELLAQQPLPWKGALLLEPSVLPDLSRTHFSNMLIVDGKDEDKEVLKQLNRFQEDAVKLGVQVKLALQNGSAHQSWSMGTERARTQQIAQFLFENRN